MGSWFKQLFNKNKLGSSTVLGVSLTPGHAAWCLVQATETVPEITESHCLSQSFDDPAQALLALNEHQSMPSSIPCYICLGHQYYNMLLVDSPDVPDQELREAVRWKVGDLITLPLEEAVVDAFRLPADAYRGRMNMLYVSVTERALIRKLVKVCERHGLDLQEITINELAMASVADAVLQLGQRGTAFLYLNGSGGTINLIENGSLYLTRTIELGNGGGVFTGNLEFQQDPVENLALDVQRSLDYYESQIGKSGISGLYVVADTPEQLALCEGLSQRLPISVEAFQLTQGSLDDAGSGMVAPALGAALGGLLEHA